MRRVRSIFVLSLLLILAGIALTLENVGIIVGASKLWPMFLLILGRRVYYPIPEAPEKGAITYLSRDHDYPVGSVFFLF